MFADAKIANSLYHRAKGYTCKETKVSPSDGGFITIEIDRHYPPETPAAKYWLNNRQPE
jgi:hypothetical protein